MTNQTRNKIGLTFHRSFPLSRDRIRQVLDVAYRHDKFTLDMIRSETSLGTIQVECDPRYASGTGLIDSENALTDFGKLVVAHDADMNSPTTQWIMHYHLVAPHHRGATFWLRLNAHLAQIGNILRSDWLAKDLDAFVQEAEGRVVEMDTLRKTATAFLGTYSQRDGLGALNLLKKEGDDYLVDLPQPINTAAFAYALADFWAAQWGESHEVGLSRLTGESGLAPLLLLGSGEANEILGELHAQGVLRVERSVRPYKVFRLWSRLEEIRDHLYDNV